MHGAPYVEAYLDQSSGKPKLEPGQCRLLHENVPQEVFQPRDNDPHFSRLRAAGATRSYFYWMCSTSADIDDFCREYQDAYQLKYAGMLNALKKYSHSPA
jgi:hypothetical protein